MRTAIWAHRGASADAPENTLEAFALAAKQGADGIELDVHLSADGVPVVIHDATIDRVSDRSGFVGAQTVRQLEQANVADARSGWPPTVIPTLEQVYELMRPTGLAINVELKGALTAPGALEQAVLRSERKMGMRGRIFYASFNPYRLMALRERDPQAYIGLLYLGGFFDAEQVALRLGANALHPHISALREEGFRARCRKLGLALHVWGANTAQELRFACAREVEAVITDHPELGNQLCVIQRMYPVV